MDYEQILLDSGYSTLSAKDHKDALEKALEKRGLIKKRVISKKTINEVVEDNSNNFKDVSEVKK
jgi:hypothetical protein